jgi:hypothetical protein
MNIYQKLIEVRKSVPYLKKEAEGTQYKYTSSSQVLGNLKATMDEMGLLLVPKIIHHNLYEKNTTNAKEHLTELTMEFIWINAEKPEEQIVCPWYGQGLDTGEKGVGKAVTYAEKYFMLKFFNIPTDKDDPDSFQNKIDGKDDKPDKPNKQDKPKGNQTPPPPAGAETGTQPGQVIVPLITEPQAKRLFAIAKGNQDIVRSVLADFGYTSSKDIKKSDYDKICKAIEKKI